MKVLIVGSNEEMEPKLAEAFGQACHQIGAALAKDEIGIVIASEDKKYADRHVLEGLAEAEQPQTVVLIRSDEEETADLDRLSAEGKIKLTSRRVRSWMAGRVPLILEADAVLVIGGRNRSASTGAMAVALEKPMLAVGSFGGAGKALLDQFEAYYGTLGGLKKSDLSALGETWSPGKAQLVVSVLELLVQRRAFMTQPRLPFGLYMGLMMLCLVSWVAVFNSDAIPYSYSLFIILGVAGLLGTMLRNNLRLVFDPTARFSWNELLIEVGAGLLLAFALALLYLVGAVTIKGSAEVMFPTGPAEFQRVAVVMTLLGLGGGLMIEQAADRVRGWFLERLAPSRP
jgi:hypothetical protein